MKFKVTVIGVKRTLVPVEAESPDQAQAHVESDMRNGDVPEFDEMFDSLRVEAVNPEEL